MHPLIWGGRKGLSTSGDEIRPEFRKVEKPLKDSWTAELLKNPAAGSAGGGEADGTF
jgi:hypothetical protein